MEGNQEWRELVVVVRWQEESELEEVYEGVGVGRDGWGKQE